MLPRIYNTANSRWNDRSPLRDLSDFQREVDRLFDDFAPTVRGWTTARTYAPVCDVQERDDHYLMSFDLPGVSKDDVNIEVVDGQLTISGERSQEDSEKGKNYFLSERSHGKFMRAFTFPAAIDADKIEATYQDGVLRLAVPKAASARPKQIKIGNGKTGMLGKLLGSKTTKETAEKKEDAA